jgi:hypothetical protein
MTASCPEYVFESRVAGATITPTVTYPGYERSGRSVLVCLVDDVENGWDGDLVEDWHGEEDV